MTARSSQTWDEYKPNPVPPGRIVRDGLQLSAHTGGSSLGYFDRPGGQKGNTIDFSTFLISDFGNKTYDVLGKGFNWATTVDVAGIGKISDISKDKDFIAEFAKEIKDEFGWQRAHAPDTQENANWRVREKGPAGAVVNVQLTNGGKTIENKDGSMVQFSKSIPAGSEGVDFDLPRWPTARK